MDFLTDSVAEIAAIWAPTMGYATVDSEVLQACNRAVEALADAGVEVVEVDSVFDRNPVWDWLVLWSVSRKVSVENA